MKQTIRLTESDLRRMVSESVRRLLGEDVEFTMHGNHYVFKGPDAEKKAKATMKKLRMLRKIENGEKIEEPKKRKKVAKEAMGEDQASPKALAANVKKLVSDTSLISVKGFIDHSERQFGPRATTTLMNMFKKESGEGMNPFVTYSSIYRDIMTTISEIEKWGKKNEYAVYERARKLGFLLEDLVEALEKLAETYDRLIQKRTLFNAFGNDANVIIGNGHSLGLKSLVFAKGGLAMSKLTGTMLGIANQLKSISDNGRDPFDYEI